MAKYDDAPVNKAKSNQEAVQDDHNVIGINGDDGTFFPTRMNPGWIS